MSTNSVEGRLVRLEHYLKPAACPACYGKPSRVVTIDPVTNQEMGANLPADGCPSCGTAIFREYLIVIDETDAA